MSNRIDVHHHLVPPFWSEALSGHGGDPSGWHSPAWSVDTSLAFMDAQRIATAVLSLTAPGVTGWEAAGRRAMARRVNEFGADLVTRWPDRFGSFATLPLPDLEGTSRARLCFRRTSCRRRDFAQQLCGPLFG